ncbi:MAG: Ig-like domain-containing protein, partial [Pseudonocardiaceae bacterium]
MTLKDAATDRGTTLQAGEYDITAKCVKGLTQESFGTFTAAMYFTSATAYTTTDPNAGPVATTTSLTVSPVSPAGSGTVETLTATVAPAGAVGSVQFKDNGTNVGSAVPLSGGTASLTQTLASG